MDDTEQKRRQIMAEYEPQTERSALEAKYGQVWTTDQLTSEFEILAFLAPFVVVKRRCDGMKGSLQFQPYPRFYFTFQEGSTGGEV